VWLAAVLIVSSPVLSLPSRSLVLVARGLVVALVLSPRSFRRPGCRCSVIRRTVALALLVVGLGLGRWRRQANGRGDLHHGRVAYEDVEVLKLAT
jgi:hypothetical protein